MLGTCGSKFNLGPFNQLFTVGNEIMDKNTEQSEEVKVREAEGGEIRAT